MSSTESQLVVRVSCAVCGETGATIGLTPPTVSDGTAAGQGWRLSFWSIAGGNGGDDPITAEEAAQLLYAFHEPLEYRRVHTPSLYDDAGFCSECELPYCSAHWHTSTTGFGTCPQGHGKSLDPHWSPDDDD